MRDYKDLSQKNFDGQAPTYDTASFGAHARSLYPVLLSQLEQIPHNSLLDVGCGTGALLSPTSTLQGESIPSICHAVAISTEQ